MIIEDPPACMGIVSVVEETHWQCIRVYVRRWRQYGGGAGVRDAGKHLGATEHPGKLGIDCRVQPFSHSTYFCIGFHYFCRQPMIITYWVCSAACVVESIILILSADLEKCSKNSPFKCLRNHKIIDILQLNFAIK